ncbi:MAG: hypothetical protein AAF990_01940 [Bacteroidota bacterium]
MKNSMMQFSDTQNSIFRFNNYGMPLQLTHFIKGGSEGSEGGDSIIEVEIVEG